MKVKTYLSIRQCEVILYMITSLLLQVRNAFLLPPSISAIIAYALHIFLAISIQPLLVFHFIFLEPKVLQQFQVPFTSIFCLPLVIFYPLHSSDGHKNTNHKQNIVMAFIWRWQQGFYRGDIDDRTKVGSEKDNKCLREHEWLIARLSNWGSKWPARKQRYHSIIFYYQGMKNSFSFLQNEGLGCVWNKSQYDYLDKF